MKELDYDVITENNIIEKCDNIESLTLMLKIESLKINLLIKHKLNDDAVQTILKIVLSLAIIIIIIEALASEVKKVINQTLPPITKLTYEQCVVKGSEIFIPQWVFDKYGGFKYPIQVGFVSNPRRLLN